MDFLSALDAFGKANGIPLLATFNVMKDAAQDYFNSYIVPQATAVKEGLDNFFEVAPGQYLPKSIVQGIENRSKLYSQDPNSLTGKLDDYFRRITFDNSSQGKEARIDLALEALLTAVPALRGKSKVAREYATELADAATKSRRAFANKLDDIIVKETTKVPQIRKAVQSTQTFTNPQLEREFKNYITRFPNATKEQFKTHLNRNNKELYNRFLREENKFPAAKTSSGASASTTTPTTTSTATSVAPNTVASQTAKQTFTNPELEREYQNYISRFPEATSEQFQTYLQRNNPNLVNYFRREADKFVSAEPITATTSNTILEQYSKEASKLDGSLQKVLNEAKSFNKFSGDPIEAQLLSLIKSNTEELAKLAKETGVKKKEEIPYLLKFADQMNQIVKNAPENIRRAAQGLKPKGLGDTGLSQYDLYQAFKEAGNNLLPKFGRDNKGIRKLIIPGGVIGGALFASLGYNKGDQLSKASMQVINPELKEVDPSMQSEYDLGMAYPQLQDYIEEYNTGLSGRRYHTVGDRIYAFDTGQPVNVQQAMDDINAKLDFDNKQVLDRTRSVEQQLADIQQAMSSGYNVPQETVQRVQNEYQQLQQQSQNLPARYDLTGYDPEKDLVEQVKASTSGLQPQVDTTGEQSGAGTAGGEMSFDQQIVNRILNPNQGQQQIDYNRLYEEVFNNIAQRTYDELDNYFNPDVFATDWAEYERDIALGRRARVTAEQYYNQRKLQAMQQMTPKIFEATNAIIKQAQSTGSGADAETLIKLLEWNLNRQKAGETARNNLAGNIIQAAQAEETARANRQREQQNYLNYQETARSNLTKEATAQQNAATSRMNALTGQQAEQRQQSLVPYQQAEYIGSFLGNSSMSDLTPDQILNANPQVFGQVFPTTQNQTQQVQPQPQQQGPGFVEGLGNLFNNVRNFVQGQ